MLTQITPVYRTAEIRQCESQATERFGILPETMMDRAGLAAFQFLIQQWPEADRIAVVCGSGNNGGDGFVLAHYAKAHGLEVNIWLVQGFEQPKGHAFAAFKMCEEANIPVKIFQDASNLQNYDVIVDALFGIGLHGSIPIAAAEVIHAINQSHVPVLSIDIPSGVNGDTGHVENGAVNAHTTITFIGLKLGLMTGKGMSYTGKLVCNDLQLPRELLAAMPVLIERMTLNQFASYLEPRPRDWHKGNAGHVLVIGGDEGYSGAPRMAAEAALRVGAGLVTIATHPAHAEMMNVTHPEIMAHGVKTAAQLKELMDKATVIVLGPGLGKSSWSKTLFNKALTTHLPLLVDADGLNALSALSVSRENWVLTPHPGEAARLLQTTSQAIQQDRLTAVQDIQQRYQGACVLKGAGTLVATKDAPFALCDAGNPGMATAGTGDVLSGVIGGLMAQGIPLPIAAKLGVCLHASAGDMAAEAGERGMVATDLIPYLHLLCNP